jgi:hypothetical protein
MMTQRAHPSAQRRLISQTRLLRFMQGISFWLTILLFFVMQSVAAEATEEAPDRLNACARTAQATPWCYRKVTITSQIEELQGGGIGSISAGRFCRI